jgi:hypothetical protein
LLIFCTSRPAAQDALLILPMQCIKPAAGSAEPQHVKPQNRMCCTMPGSDTGFAMLQVHVLAEVFKSAHATALAWVHLLLLDLVQAR